MLGEAVVDSAHEAMSGAAVFRIRRNSGPDTYLKIARCLAGQNLRDEAERTTWLRLRNIEVPTILKEYHSPVVSALLMSAVPGRPLATWKGAPQAAIQSLARGLNALHALPPALCPFMETLAVRLGRAKQDLSLGLIDGTHFADRNANVSPSALYQRLVASMPATEDIVVAHGDATLSNILLDREYHVGFVDCGHAGRADRYVDLALIVEGLLEQFGANAAMTFVTSYDWRDWDPQKAKFFLDLYELF
jgi:aminoglycoside 3'-phosphotransferase II